MTYTYRYQDGDKEEFDVVESMKATPLIEYNGRPVKRLISGGSGTIFKEGGVGWPDREHNGAYTRVQRKEDGTIKVVK